MTLVLARGGPRLAAVLLVGAAALWTAQAPALAHPIGTEAPTNYESQVISLSGDDRGVEAHVAGGDAYLVLDVPAGVEVEVPGYHPPEPYLRFEADGAVYVNLAGPTHHYNTHRFADVLPQHDIRADADPRWDRVATDGSHAWMDHRIHWMQADPPPRLDLEADGPQHVRDWVVPILVDGEPVTITGSLTWVPTPSPALPLALGLLLVAAGVARRSLAASTIAVALGATAMTALALAEIGVPYSEPSSHVADLTAAGVALLLALRALSPQLTDRARAATLAAGSVSLGVAAVYNLDVLSTAVLPGWLPSVVGRPLVGLAAGGAVLGLVTAALALARSGDHAEPETVTTEA
jgi:hypothetical protein